MSIQHTSGVHIFAIRSRHSFQHTTIFTLRFCVQPLSVVKGIGPSALKLVFLSSWHSELYWQWRRKSNQRTGLLQAQRVPGASGSQISGQSAHEGSTIVSPTHRLPLPPKKSPCYLFLLEAESNPAPYCDCKDVIGNWTLHVPACSSILRPTALPRITATVKDLYGTSWF